VSLADNGPAIRRTASSLTVKMEAIDVPRVKEPASAESMRNFTKTPPVYCDPVS